MPSLIPRLLGLLAVLFFVISITFFVIRLSPGGPFDTDRKLSPAIEHQLLLKYKLNGPLYKQYFDYINDLLHGDLRLSTKYRNRTVKEILVQTLPITFTLGGTALCLALFFGIWLGALSAIYPRSWIDYLAMHLAVFAISLPSFILGPLLILTFALWLQWLPVGGWGSPLQLLLPSVTLALPFTAVIFRLLRDSLRETLQEDFIRTAYAKGLTKSTITYHHALRIAILPVISYVGPLAANLLTGSVVVETIFHIPGAGCFFVNSILNRDSFLLGGIVIVYCSLLIVFNFLVDLLYIKIDPRISS